MNWMQTQCTLRTNIDSIVGHHVLVVVESMLNVIVFLLAAKKPLKKMHSSCSVCKAPALFLNTICKNRESRTSSEVNSKYQTAAFKKRIGRNRVNSRTTSNEQLCSCMQSDLREVTKLKVRGWVFFQKLISRRTLTPLSTTASVIISSIGDQYLLMQPLELDN